MGQLRPYLSTVHMATLKQRPAYVPCRSMTLLTASVPSRTHVPRTPDWALSHDST